MIWFTLIQKIRPIKKVTAIAVSVTGLAIAVSIIDIERNLEWSISNRCFPRLCVETKEARIVEIVESKINLLQEKTFSRVLGKAIIKVLQKDTGVYANPLNNNYQVLLDDRGDKNSFLHTFLKDIFAKNRAGNKFCDRLSLIDTTIPAIDYFLNPSCSSNFSYAQTSEVHIHATITNQVIARVSEQTKSQKVSKTGEWLWILGWSFIGGGLSLVWFQTDLWQKNFSGSIKLAIVSLTISIGTLFASSYILLLFGWWLPAFSALSAFIIANFSVAGYCYQSQRKIAFTDPLTKIANRRFCDRYLEQQWLKNQREKKDLAVILCDVDPFEFYNETDRQQQSDVCLRKIALLLSNSIRNVDFTARYDNQKFVVVLPDSNVKTALLVAERIRAKLQKIHIFHEELATAEHISLSMGIASLYHDNVASIEELLNIADEALSRAKKLGGDCAVVSQLES